jgi:hypothetical protein
MECKEEEKIHPLYEKAKNIEYENVETGNYNYSGLLNTKLLSQPFANFTTEQQNFIINNNFKSLKYDIISWDETQEEWKNYLLEKEKTLELSGLVSKVIGLEKVIFEDGVISTNFVKTLDALIKKSDENENITTKLNEIKKSLEVALKLMNGDLSYYLRIKKGKVKKESINFSRIMFENRIEEKLKEMKSYTNDKIFIKKIRKFELSRLYKGDSMKQEFNKLLIEFVGTIEKEFLFFETCMSYEIFLLEKEMNEKLIELISIESIRRMALKREDMLFTLVGPPEKMN